MRLKTHLCLAAVAGLLAAGGPAFAQSGTTSGPAAGSPATLGTGGATPASPHQTDAVRNSGGVPVTGERQGQLGGTANTVEPGKSDAGSGVTQQRR